MNVNMLKNIAEKEFTAEDSN